MTKFFCILAGLTVIVAIAAPSVAMANMKVTERTTMHHAKHRHMIHHAKMCPYRFHGKCSMHPIVGNM